MKSMTQKKAPRQPCVQSGCGFSLAGKLVYLGENESTALMDNAGEGTPGTGLWEGKSEQKKPFSCLHLCSLENKVLASCWDRQNRGSVRIAVFPLATGCFPDGNIFGKSIQRRTARTPGGGVRMVAKRGCRFLMASPEKRTSDTEAL